MEKERPESLVGTPSLNRRINAARVMQLLQRHGPISRADLVRLSGVKANTISSIVDRFIDAGLAREIGHAESTGGRRPVLVEIQPSGLCTIGIELDENELRGGLIDFSGRVLRLHKQSLPDHSPDTVVLRAKSLVTKLCAEADVRIYKLSGVGVAVPGIIDAREKSVLYSYPLGWENVQLGTMLADALNMEVRIINNAVAGALHAHFISEGDEPVSLLFYLLMFKQFMRKGICNLGCGIVLDGRAYLGKGHMAGDIAVAIEHPLNRARKELKSEQLPSMDELVELSLRGGEAMQRIWSAFAAELGAEIARGIDYLNPTYVVIGSDNAVLESLIGEDVRAVVREKSVSGFLAEQHIDSTPPETPVKFNTLDEGTLASAAAMPFIYEFSQAPLLRASALM